MTTIRGDGGKEGKEAEEDVEEEEKEEEEIEEEEKGGEGASRLKHGDVISLLLVVCLFSYNLVGQNRGRHAPGSRLEGGERAVGLVSSETGKRGTRQRMNDLKVMVIILCQSLVVQLFSSLCT